MRRTTLRLAAAGPLSTVVVLAGCAGPPKDAGFSRVQALSRDRTGYDVNYTHGESDQQTVNATTVDLLRKELTLGGAVKVALLNNRQLQATYDELGIARGQLIEDGLFANPVLSFDPWLYYPGASIESLLSEDFVSILYQPLRVAVRKNEVEATKLRVTAQVVGIVGEMRRAYFDYRADQQLVDMHRQVVRSTQAAYLTAARMRQAGDVQRLEVLRERAMFEEAKVNLNAAVQHLADSRERLNALMGLWGEQLAWHTPPRLPDLPPDDSATPEAPPAPTTDVGQQSMEAVTPGEYPKMFPPMPMMKKVKPAGETPQQEMSGMKSMMKPPPQTPEARAAGLAGGPTTRGVASAPADVLGADQLGGRLPVTLAPAERFAQVERAAMDRNLDLAAARFVIQAEAYRLKVDVAYALVPFANLGLDVQKDRGTGQWGLGPGGSVKVPVFNWGQGVYPRDAARLRQRAEQYAQLAITIRAAARDAEARLQASHARAVYYRDVIVPLRTAVTAESQLQYNAMQISQFDLLVAKRQQIEAGQMYINALRDYWHARSDLEQILDGTVPGDMLPGGAGMSGQPGTSGSSQAGTSGGGGSGGSGFTGDSSAVGTEGGGTNGMGATGGQ